MLLQVAMPGVNETDVFMLLVNSSFQHGWQIGIRVCQFDYHVN